MKILFIQLPLQDHSHGYINGNIEYAPAAVSGFISRRFPSVSCETLPSVIANFGSDELIVNYILSLSPEYLSFTSYLWNVERNLRISERVKKINPAIQIFFGGPEISNGSYILSEPRPSVDWFISGEGEWFFRLFFSGEIPEINEIRGNRVAVQPVGALIKTEDIFEPLSGNRLNTMSDGSVFLELTRGCPYRCSYCYYSRNYKKVREIRFSALTDVIRKRKDISEIYILSPTFDRSPDFIENLKVLKSLNHEVRLHTEMRTDRITAETAQLVYDAGFRSLEVGLQSLNKRALISVNRNSSPEKELEGMARLRDAGIDLKIGIIPGLPGDDPENFIRTIDILVENGFSESIELYPLMVLPGTAIREMADRDGVSYQQKPPYFFLEGWNFTTGDISDVSIYLEEKTGLSSSLFYLPDFTGTVSPLFIKGISISGGGEWPSMKQFTSTVDTAVADIHIHTDKAADFYNAFRRFCSDCDPHRFYNIIIHSDAVIDNEIIFDIISSNERDNYYRRINLYTGYTDGSIFHFFQVTEDPEVYNSVIMSGAMITPLFRLNEKTVSILPSEGGEELSLLIEKGMYNRVKGFLKKYYSEDFQHVAFSDENEMQMFFNDIGQEYVKLPYSFGIKNL
ncbi:MAG TPA: B12-binding domain-containing radical SAM protein [Spirochaetota bacterium]|nr:B12-binding domain-containing radical SAM protein [Spirochaetota bacterium]HPJ33270.1 B12-binding domain-containing radical SAM protein [Spirochaetota bacterium]